MKDFSLNCSPLFLVLVLMTACTVKLPDLSNESFACEDNQPILGTAEYPCISGYACKSGHCAPRLSCGRDGTEIEGCGANKRCTATLDPYVSSVSCENGSYTLSSTRSYGCACSSDLLCAAEEFTSLRPYTLNHDQLSVWVLDGFTNLNEASQGDLTEHGANQSCVQPCSSESNCPALHTCRPAPVLSKKTPASIEPSVANAIGVCFPELSPADTSSAALEFKAQRASSWSNACLSDADCKEPGSRCRAIIQTILDHPKVPLQEVFPEHLAVFQMCVKIEGISFTAIGKGCTTSAQCENGVCADQRCRALCNPEDKSGCLCRSVRAEFQGSTSQGSVFDRVFICDL